MNKIKYRKYFLFFFIILLFTGCNKSNVLKCKLSNDKNSEKVIITFNNTNTKVDDIKIETIIDLGIFKSEELINQIKYNYEEECNDSFKTDCSVLIDEEKLIINYKITKYKEIDNNKSLDEIKELLEEDGYSCTN